MPRQLNHLFCLVAALATFITAPADAALVQLTLTGEVFEIDTFDNSSGPATGAFALAGVDFGDPVSVTVLYDTAATPSGFATDPIGFGPGYLPGFTDGLTIDVGPLQFISSDYLVGVTNDGPADSVTIQHNDMPSDGGITLDLPPFGNAVLVDNSGTALSSDSLPSALAIGDFDSVGGELFTVLSSTGSFSSLRFSIDSITSTVVPEPGSLALFSAGVFGLGTRRRR